MARYEELLAREDAIRAVLASGAEARLRSIPGVIHVGIGLKESGGRVTDDHCIRVYVLKKLPNGELSPKERIPAQIEGIPTDVNVVGAYEFSVDNSKYRPIKGGIQITNRIVDMNETMTGSEVERGTLGCIATLNSDKSPVLLSNWHVLMAHYARHNDRIYQPGPASLAPVPLADLPLRPTDKDNAIAKIVAHAITEQVDAAIARIDVSSWCNCCGIDSKNEINGLSLGGHPPSNFIVGQRPAVSGMTVYKVGWKSGRTVGRVVTASKPPFTVSLQGVNYAFSNQIEIESSDPTKRFSIKGDSGSAIIDDQNYIVGLLFGANNLDPPGGRTMANHIADVCSALGITINFTPSSTHSGTQVAVPAAFHTSNASEDVYRDLRERLMEDRAGRWLLEIAETHRVEVVNLVNGKRPVTVAWHRSGGPAFLAVALGTLREGGEDLPSPIERTSFADALERMGIALVAHGSEPLCQAVEAFGGAIIASVRESANLGELLERLNAALFGDEEAPDEGAHPAGGAVFFSAAKGARP